jgi:DNA invertase Pin-like site-specific DNA recombinase
MVYAYIRQAPGFPQLATQQRDILSFLLNKELEVDKEVVEYATKNLPIDERKEFEGFLQSMTDGNTVIVSSLTILSDKVEELIKVINCMLSHNVNLWIVSANTLMNKETNMVDIFPLLNELRQDEKEKTNHIGRPKGSKSSSKFDVYQGQILSLLVKGTSVSAIARELEVSRSSLKDYIESRGMKDLAEGTWADAYTSRHEVDMDNVLLICPFEKESAENKKKVS